MHSSKIIIFASLKYDLTIQMMNTDNFTQRHLGPGDDDVKKMLEVIGVHSLNQLIDETIPSSIRLS
jgi:glycine cleavage system pyridoxal-binding protein P